MSNVPILGTSLAAGTQGSGCLVLLSFPLSYPFPITGPSHPPISPVSCNQVSCCASLIAFLSPFGEGMRSPGIWSRSRLANASSAFSRQGWLGARSCQESPVHFPH